MLVSDLVGGFGAVALAGPAVKDQYYRFRRSKEENEASRSPAPKLRQILATAWEKRRNGYDGADSLLTLAGAGLILVSFLMKMFDA
jgi:hypothetical protein